MQFKSFMEALKGKQHKIDKNKNGEIDAQDFKLLRKEESEETTETIEESEERMARADYKVGASGRKSHKEIVFTDAESKDDEKDKIDEQIMPFDADSNEPSPAFRWGQSHLRPAPKQKKKDTRGGLPLIRPKKRVKEEVELDEKEMSDADMAERERIVKGMKKNLAGFKARYGDRAKEVMYATATKQAMKEETVEEAVQKADIPAYLRKQQGQTPLKLSDLKRKDTLSDKENLAKARNEEVEEIDEKSDQAKQNKIMKNMMDASRGARYKLNNPVPDADPEHKTARAQNVAIGRALRSEEKKDDVPFDGPYTKSKPVKNSDGTIQSPMSRARELAKQGIKKDIAASRMDQKAKSKIKEAKDEQEYGYEGDMAMNQLSTLTRCAEMIKDTLKPDTDLPEWVQSKITLATDYIVTAADYLHSELEEQAPVAPVPDKKYIKGTPEHKAYKATKKPINGMPTNVKEEVELDEVEHKTLSYTDFVATLLEYETKGGRYVHKGTYGGSYSDPEGADDADDKKPKQQSAEKRGRGRPAGAKSGAGKITGTSKLYK